MDFRNNGTINTIVVHSKVVHETDSGEARGDEVRWMRCTLDTVGKSSWPLDAVGRPIHPAGFEELAKKLDRPLHPPGRDVRCIVSVAMLTEGWGCNTVTHIIGLRRSCPSSCASRWWGGAATRQLRLGRDHGPDEGGDGQGLRCAL